MIACPYLECELQLLGVVLLDPEQAVVVFCIDGLHVLERDGLVQHHLVERPDEEAVKELAVVDGHAGDAADELKGMIVYVSVAQQT